MAWIELHQALFTHRKTVEAAAILDLPEVYVVGHLSALWTWALDNAPDGEVRASERVLERVAQWPGEKGKLVEALVEAGFFSRSESGFVIHDWHDYAGRLIERRAKNADRMKGARAGHAPTTSAGENAHVQRTCNARAGATVPNRTVPNRTVTLPGEVEGAGRPAAGAPRDASGGASPTPPPPGEIAPKVKAPTVRASRLPEGWNPSVEAVHAMRDETGLDLATLKAETVKFCDHFAAKSGRDATKVNWEAAWRNWVRRSGEFAFRASPGTPARAAPKPEQPTPEARRQGVAERLAQAVGVPSP
jgi:hypothetical protein